jgi:hypothetical protein
MAKGVACFNAGLYNTMTMRGGCRAYGRMFMPSIGVSFRIDRTMHAIKFALGALRDFLLFLPELRLQLP